MHAQSGVKHPQTAMSTSPSKQLSSSLGILLEAQQIPPDFPPGDSGRQQAGSLLPLLFLLTYLVHVGGLVLWLLDPSHFN